MSEEKKFIPSDEQKALAGKIAELEATNAKLKENIQTWQAKTTDYEKRYAGIDPDKVKADAEALETLMKQKATTDGKAVEDLKKRYEEQFAKEYGTKIKELTENLTAKERKLYELTVTNAMLGKTQHFQAGSADLLKGFFDKNCHLQDDQIVIKDEKGEIRRSPADPTKPMSPDEYVKELEAKFPYLVPSTTRKGDLPPGQKSKGNGNQLDMAAWGRMSKEEKMKLDPDTRLKFVTESFKQ